MNAPYWSTQISWREVRKALHAMVDAGWARSEAVEVMAEVLMQAASPLATIPFEDQPVLDAILRMLWVVPSGRGASTQDLQATSALSAAIEKIQRIKKEREKQQESPR